MHTVSTKNSNMQARHLSLKHTQTQTKTHTHAHIHAQIKRKNLPWDTSELILAMSAFIPIHLQ